jgi:alpha-D-ribose 1-methylphosphonate 5-triphosphate diphosphatase
MWLSDFRIVLEDRVLPRGSLRIEGDTIAELREGRPLRGAASPDAGAS